MKHPIPIRAQLTKNKKKWQLARKTPAGAWELVSSMTHDSQLTAEAMVDWYIKVYPGQYTKSN